MAFIPGSEETVAVAVEELHPVDRQMPAETWNRHQLDSLLIFCILDRATTYAQVCKAYDALASQGLTTRDWLRTHISAFGEETMVKRITLILREAGYRFPEPGAEFIVLFALNDVNLRTVSRDMLVSDVKGIGMKLASMFLRNTRGEQYVPIDVHMKKWLADHGCPYTSYEEQEQWFREYCEERGLSVYEADMAIWNEMRR